MRLICPNCGATYEVDAGLIPPGGRDVQCSNCGHGWFQEPEGLDADEPEVAEPAPADVETDEEAEPPEDAGPETVSPRRRELDPGITDILREEAEREAAARQAEKSSGLESQPDLGLDESSEDTAQDRSSAARARMARLRGRKDSDAEPESSHGPRSETLPDVDQINSTLRGQQERGEMPEAVDFEDTRERRGGFRFGFLLIVLLCVVLVAVYALAPRIAEMVPAAAPTLTAYVEWVNMVRGQINGLVDQGVVWVQGMIG